MRKYAYLRCPQKTGCGSLIYRIMLYETDEGTYLFEYDSPDAPFCCADQLYDSPEEVFEEWNERIDGRGWITLDDPLPDCQADAFLPIRVKGRNTGKPQWGTYEILADGEWKDWENSPAEAADHSQKYGGKQ